MKGYKLINFQFLIAFWAVGTLGTVKAWAQQEVHATTSKLQQASGAVPTAPTVDRSDQNILVNKRTGKRTSVNKVLESTTEAGYGTINGVATSGAGYYYTPGPANRPVAASGGGYTPAPTSNNNGLFGGINSEMIGGSMVLLTGAQAFMGFNNLGDSPSEEEEDCADCNRRNIPASVVDPNLGLSGLQGVSSGSADLLNKFRQIGMDPFELANGNINFSYLEVLNDALMREPYSELSDLAADEIAENFCPNFKNLDVLKRQALTVILFSETMRSTDNFNERRVRTIQNSAGQDEKAYGLCGITEERAQTVINRNNTFNLVVQNTDALYDYQTNIRLCVMDVFDHAQESRRNNSPVRPFSNKSFLLSDEAKNKIRNLPICRNPGAGNANTPSVSEASSTTGTQ